MERVGMGEEGVCNTRRASQRAKARRKGLAEQCSAGLASGYRSRICIDSGYSSCSFGKTMQAGGFFTAIIDFGGEGFVLFCYLTSPPGALLPIISLKYLG